MIVRLSLAAINSVRAPEEVMRMNKADRCVQPDDPGVDRPQIRRPFLTPAVGECVAMLKTADGTVLKVLVEDTRGCAFTEYLETIAIFEADSEYLTKSPVMKNHNSERAGKPSRRFERSEGSRKDVPEEALSRSDRKRSRAALSGRKSGRGGISGSSRAKKQDPLEPCSVSERLEKSLLSGNCRRQCRLARCREKIKTRSNPG